MTNINFIILYLEQVSKDQKYHLAPSLHFKCQSTLLIWGHGAGNHKSGLCVDENIFLLGTNGTISNEIILCLILLGSVGSFQSKTLIPCFMSSRIEWKWQHNPGCCEWRHIIIKKQPQNAFWGSLPPFWWQQTKRTPMSAIPSWRIPGEFKASWDRCCNPCSMSAAGPALPGFSQRAAL